MLNKSSINIAINAAFALADKGLTVVAGPNTVVAELTRLSQPALPVNLTDVAEDKRVETFVASFDEDYASQHSAMQDEVIKTLSEVVSKHISFARNVVKPTVLHFAEIIQTFIQSYQPADAAAAFEIVQLAFPEVLADETFVDSIERYTGKTSLTPESILKLEAVDEATLTGMIVTGTTRLDKSIQEWLGRKEPAFLQSIWKDYFSVDSFGGAFTEALGPNNFEGADKALAVYLIALHLSNNIPASVDVPLTTYNKIISQYLEYAGSALKRQMVVNSAYNSTYKALVIAKDQRAKKIFVNAPVYKEWIANGGDNTVLLGLLIGDFPGTSANSINEIAEKCKQEWNRYCMFTKSTESIRALKDYKDMLLISFTTDLRELAQEEKDYIIKNSNHIDHSIKLATEFIECINSVDMSQVNDIALVLIAKCRFHYTSAYQILNDINEAGRINPNVDPREAALLAVNNYLSDYMAAQLAIKQ